jgi:hypothetical protein
MGTPRALSRYASGERLRHSFAAVVIMPDLVALLEWWHASAAAVGEGTQVNVVQYRQNGQLALESPEE